MKSYNHLFVSWGNFRSFLSGINMDYKEKVLVRIHSGIHTEWEMSEFARDIEKLLPEATIIGCSTSHVICEGRIVEKACLISITTFDECEVWGKSYECIYEDGAEKSVELLGKEVAADLQTGEDTMMLVFFPFGYFKTVEFIDYMNVSCPKVKMIGGKAADREALHHRDGEASFVLLGSKVSTRHLVTACISAPALHIYEDVVCGVETLGKRYSVTKLSGRYIEEIDDVPAAEWYEGMLGKEELLKDPSLAAIFPMVPSDAATIAYSVSYFPYYDLPNPWRAEKRSRIGTYMEIDEGMRFAVGYFDPQKIVNSMNEVYQALRTEPVEVLFAYDCLSRMWMLHDCANWEIGQLATTNVSGAMLAGEVSNTENKNVYANLTFVVAGLSEDSEARLFLKNKALKNTSALQHDNVQMINYLLKKGNKQLNKQLAEQQDKMHKAMFYYDRLDLENHTKCMFDKEQLRIDKIAVFGLHNEKILGLFMGQSALFEVLKAIYHDFKRNLEPFGFHLYSYREYSLLIAANDTVSDEDFLTETKEVYDQLNELAHKELQFSYGCAVVMHEEDILRKAEIAIQYGIKSKKKFVQYSEVPQEVLDIKEKMRILTVLKEALLHDRIVPYFQGIYDNREKRINMYEALIRIQDEQGNLYFPNQFLPVAKEYNLYEAVSAIMVKKVMELFIDKNDKVTLNLSVLDLYDRDMIKIIFKYLKQAAHPENFVFELVESEEVQDYQFIKQFADSIHEHGAKIAIDDFGSGFSNLLHIIRIDADIIKIDGEIIKEICNDVKCREFVEVINAWCSRQNKEVVGEFVENDSIQTKIEEIGITYSQGYYFAKPRPWQDN